MTESLPFPVVTLCNFNALRNDSLQAAKEDGMDIFKNLFTGELAKNISSNRRKRRSNDPAPTLESLANQEGSTYDSDDDDDEDFSWDDDEDEEFRDPFKKDPTFLKKEQFAVLMAKEDLSLLSMIGHQFDDLVLSCTYRGVPCKNFSSIFWRKFWHYKYGNCFVFNSGKTKSGENAPILKSNKPGPSHGLILELNVEQEEYVGQMSPEAGIKLDISPHGEMPFPLERGLSLAPGYATMIGMRKACRKSCLAYNQLKRCRCMQYQFPGSSNYGICNVIDKPTLKCLSGVQKMFKENKLNCTTSCPPPCREEGYKMSSSFALWPSEKYEPIYEEALQKEHKILFTKIGSSHRKNVCKLQVFYEELNLEMITEQRSYEIEDFVSDIGGQLGLWIGFSVLTAAEFLELFMLIFHAVLKSCGAKKTQNSNHIHQDSVA
ncbi:Amiloride-sensitive sodium channel subunit beta [Stylophora pistillata]|uniref:Amiloride-sensitive sodium channel subunit beta n=1 Tax=Stylophora pistillata TaxID=50429 RepID=A0A2B4SYG4_STYPI|nr:Amiloride-sensitive sodium channel subunit beta [Stylophora pistillata]